MAKRSLYPAGIGLAVGALLVGLLLPLAIEPVDDGLASSIRTDGAVDLGPQGGATPGTDGDGPVAGSGAAGGSTSDATAATGAAGATGGTATSSGGATATGGGVAAEGAPVKVGFLLLDIGPVGRAGIDVAIDPEQQERAWRAYVADVNERGLAGRKIEPVFAAYDVLSEDSQRAACLELTEDQKVFAVVGAFNIAAPTLCVVREHATPMLAYGGNADSFYGLAQGRLLTSGPRSSRMMANAVGVLDGVKALQGKPIGIVMAETADPGGEATGHLKAALEAAGHQVVHVARFQGSTSGSQTPVEVQQMRSKGAEAVFLLSGSVNSTSFVQTADAQAFRPLYVSTDWASMQSDTSNANMPASYDGALGVTIGRGYDFRVNRPVPALARECQATYERVSKTKLAARGTNEYALTLIFCDLMRAFAAGMRAAGPSASREAFTAATTRLGPVPWASWGDGTFRPGKPDAGDHVQLVRWQADCKCFHPVGDFRRPQA